MDDIVSCLLVLLLWLIVTIGAFLMAGSHNRQIQWDFLRVTWEPYAVSGGFLLIILGSML